MSRIDPRRFIPFCAVIEWFLEVSGFESLSVDSLAERLYSFIGERNETFKVRGPGVQLIRDLAGEQPQLVLHGGRGFLELRPGCGGSSGASGSVLLPLQNHASPTPDHKQGSREQEECNDGLQRPR